MIEFVIKIENLNPVNHPLSVENFKQIMQLKKTDIVTHQMLNDNGYAPFVMTEDEKDTYTHKVSNITYVADSEGFVRKECTIIEKTDEEKMENFDGIKLNLKEALELQFNIAVSELLNGSLAGEDKIPMEEVLTWVTQELEARKYLADNTYNSLFLNNLATARNMDETILQLSEKIVEKADIYTTNITMLIGKRKNLFTLINEATTLEALNIIKW